MHVDTWANCIFRFHHQFSFPPEVPHYMTLQYVTMQYYRLTLINQEWEKKLHFWDLHSLLYLPFQLSHLEDSFLCLNPLSFLNHSKSKHFHLIPTIFLWLLGILLHSYIVVPVLCCTFHEFLKAYLKRHSVESVVLTVKEFFFINWNNQILSSAHCVDRYKQNLLIESYTCVVGVF